MKRISGLFFCAFVCAAMNAATIQVSPGSGTLASAVKNASARDILVLSEGNYTESSVKPTVALTIKAANGAHPVIALSSRFEVKADFTIEGVKIQSTGEAIRMVNASTPYSVTVRGCELSGCPSKFIRASTTDVTTPYINKLTVDNCIFHMERPATDNAPRAIEAAKAHLQLMSAEIKNCTFDGGALYR